MKKIRSKYGNKKITTPDGQTFDSKKEKERYDTLRLLEKNGQIWNLQRQVKYILLPSIKEQVPVQLKTKVSYKEKTLFKETAYYADFVYMENGEEVVEDVKASDYFQDPVYKLKKKLMYMIHHIKIKEVY